MSQAAKPVSSTPPAPPARRRRWPLRLGITLIVLLALVPGAVYYTQSHEFHERVRRLVVSRLEEATGARVELQRVDWSLLRREIVFEGLTLHGREPAGQPPLLQVPQVRARIRLVLLRRAWLRDLYVTQPAAHFMVFADGTSNLPEPKAAQRGSADITQLLKLSVRHAEVQQGIVLYNDRVLNVNGAAERLGVDLTWNSPGRHYDGTINLGEVRVAPPQTPPLSLAAESTFRIYTDRVEVPHIKLSTPRSWLEVSGAITNLKALVAQFAYRSTLDLREMGTLARLRELSAGTGQLSGEGTCNFHAGNCAVVGKAQGAGVSWTDRDWRLERVNGGFNFSLDPQRLHAGNIFATAMGGTAHGKMDVLLGHGREQTGAIDLEVNGIEVEQALRAFSTRDLPLSALQLSGHTRGTLGIHWRGSLERAQMDADLHVAPVPRAGQLPVTAEIGATIAFLEPAADIHSAEVSTPQSHLSVRGLIADNSDLHLALTTADLHEIAPLITGFRGGRAAEMPIDFAGRGAFRGTLTGHLGRPAIAGALEIHDFTTLWRRHEKQPDGSFATRTVATRWDALQGDVEYSATHEALRNGVLWRGNARIAVDANVPLVNGDYDGSQPFAAHVVLQNTSVADLQSLTGSTYEISGVLNGDVRVAGTSNQLSGSGRLSLHDGSAWQQAIRFATADVNFTENQAQLRNILVRSDLMQLSGDARINVETSEFGFDLKGTEVRIENLRALQQGRTRLSGQATFEASGSGTPAAPVINGHLRLRNLALNRQPLGDMNVDAVTRGAEMTLTARSAFKAGELNLDGRIYLRGEMPMQISGSLASSNLNPWLQTYLPLRYGAASELKLHFDAAGEARHPRDLTATVVADRWATSYAGISVANDGPIRLRLANQVLSVEQFRMLGEGGTRFLQVHGQVQLSGRRDIDLRADGSMNLKLLETADPGLMANGVANLNLQVNGSMAQPFLTGSLNVQNATIAYIDFPNGLSDINGSLIFNEDRLQVQEVTARTGGGLLHCGGFITWSLQQGISFNLSASGKDIRLRYPEGLSSTADAAFQLTGNLHSSVLAGNVTVTRLGVNPQFDFATYLAQGLHGAPAQKIDSPLNDVRLDVHIQSTPELQVQTTLARLSGNVDLRVRGTASRPVVLGRVNLLEGTISFNGTKYRLERGDVTMTNPVRIDPTLDIELSARVRDYDITLGFHGPMNRLVPSYRSDPPLSSSDIISLLALGRTAEEVANPAMLGTSQYSPTVSENASSALVGQALNSTVSSRLQRLFGVSRIKIDPNVGNSTSEGLARVTVEQQVSNNVTLTYITNLNQTTQQIIQFEYNVNKNVTVQAVRDQNGVVSIDVLFRKRKK